MIAKTSQSELFNKLLDLARGDLDLVRQAIFTNSGPDGSADLKAVMDFIIKQRKPPRSADLPRQEERAIA